MAPVGFVLSLGIIAVAFWVLYHILHDINVDEVIGAIRATQVASPHVVLY